MRSYHVEIAALVADVDQKWVDNLLSHFELPGVDSARQGVARRISQSGLEHIALVRRLSHEVGLPLSRAVALARRLLASPAGQVGVANGILIAIDRGRFESELAARTDTAAETTAPARRGRRPVRRAAGVADREP